MGADTMHSRKVHTSCNDDVEQDRMLMQHRAIFLAAGGKLLYAPVSESLQNILDLGAGI